MDLLPNACVNIANASEKVLLKLKFETHTHTHSAHENQTFF
jgi:hypothetical protein